jgi:hypothetical protein
VQQVAASRHCDERRRAERTKRRRFVHEPPLTTTGGCVDGVTCV